MLRNKDWGGGREPAGIHRCERFRADGKAKQMEVEVRFFAQVRELVGQERIRLWLPEGATVGTLRQELIGRHPALACWERLLLFAVNGQYADEHTPIRPGGEIACFPPVGGG